MELWLDLLFGNFIGLLSMIVIAVTFGIAIFFSFLFISKSKAPDESDQTN